MSEIHNSELSNDLSNFNPNSISVIFKKRSINQQTIDIKRPLASPELDRGSDTSNSSIQNRILTKPVFIETENLL